MPGRHGQKVARLKELPARERADLQRLRTDLTATTEYAPFWVIVAVALALGAGTMVGWRRVVLTVGGRSASRGMTYAQGMSAQVTAMGAIGLANVFSLPVSTTHVLSSGIAGTMIANKSGLQGWHRAQHPAGLGADPARLDAAGRRPVLGRRAHRGIRHRGARNIRAAGATVWLPRRAICRRVRRLT